MPTVANDVLLRLKSIGGQQTDEVNKKASGALVSTFFGSEKQSHSNSSTLSNAEILKQALVSRDKKLIQNAIYSKFPDVARATVSELPPHLAAVLFEELAAVVVGTISASPDYQRQLLWLREVMRQHASVFIESSHQAKECLSHLYSHCVERVRHEESIVRLQGLVDTATFQSEKSLQLTNLISQMGEDARQPLVRYVEGFDDEGESLVEAARLVQQSKQKRSATPTAERYSDNVSKDKLLREKTSNTIGGSGGVCTGGIVTADTNTKIKPKAKRMGSLDAAVVESRLIETAADRKSIRDLELDVEFRSSDDDDDQSQSDNDIRGGLPLGEDGEEFEE